MQEEAGVAVHDLEVDDGMEEKGLALGLGCIAGAMAVFTGGAGDDKTVFVHNRDDLGCICLGPDQRHRLKGIDKLDHRVLWMIASSSSE